MKLSIPKDSTSVLLDIWIQDAREINGAGLIGLTYNAPGLLCSYYREGASSIVSMTLIALTTLGAWQANGFREIDSTTMPGWYQLGLPDAVCISGARTAIVHLQGGQVGGELAMAPCPNEITFTTNNEQLYSGIKRNKAFTNLPFIMRNNATKAYEPSPTNFAIQRKIDGGAFAVGGLTNHQSAGTTGLHTIDGLASDINGLFVTFIATANNCDPVIFTVMTAP